MNTIKTYHTLAMACILILALLRPFGAEARRAKRVLVITSYNPDTQKMYNALSDFNQEMNRRNGKNGVIIEIENMNCKGLSEAHEWKSRMAGLLKMKSKTPPDLVITLGQEAWASYLSQTSKMARRTPVMPAMVSSNTVFLNGKDTCNLRTCRPRSVYYNEINDFNIAGGIFYKYDIEKSLQLTRLLFPKTRRIALITDFSLGGLAMQSHVMRIMKNHKDIDIILLDGRKHTLFDICAEMKRLPQKGTVIWLGTWRIDSSENYNLTSTSDVLRQACPQIPAIALSSVGMGNWAVGGYLPEYSAQGEQLADLASDFLNNKKSAYNRSRFIIMPCKMSFDMQQLYTFNIDKDNLPDDAIILNSPSDFFTEHQGIILTVLSILAFLTLSLLTALYYIIKIRKLKRSLEIQSGELKAAKDAAEKANSVKTSFIANMSHEIRTPLNAIVGFANLMGEDDYDKEDKQQFSHIIQENSNLLLNLINDILDISKIESGKLPICWEKCDIFDLCRTSMLSVKQARCLENVEFIEDFPTDQLIIDTDPSRLKQVVINLLTNASKFTKRGFIKLCIHPDQKSGMITFAVADTGTGIPADKAEMVFERFVKLNQYVQGTGLGLPLSKVIIESLGGKIWVDTEYTQGARFVFTHPMRRKDKQTGGGKKEEFYHRINSSQATRTHTDGKKEEI